MTCDKCGKDGKNLNHHMLLQHVTHVDKSAECLKIGLCWSCYRKYKKEERIGETDFDIIWEECKTQNCGKEKSTN